MRSNSFIVMGPEFHLCRLLSLQSVKNISGSSWSHLVQEYLNLGRKAWPWCEEKKKVTKSCLFKSGVRGSEKRWGNEREYGHKIIYGIGKELIKLFKKSKLEVSLNPSSRSSGNAGKSSRKNGKSQRKWKTLETMA